MKKRNTDSMRSRPVFNRASRSGTTAKAGVGREMLDSLIEGLSEVPVFLTDAHGTITSHSVAIEGMLGYSLEDTVGRPMTEFFSGGAATARRIREKLSTSDQVVGQRVSVRTKGGKDLQCSLTARLVKGKDGQVAGIACTLQEAAKEVDAERRLREEVSRLGSLIVDSADAIVEFDNRNRIRRWNRGAEAVFGYSEREALWRGLSLIVPDANARRAISKEIRECTGECATLRGYEICTTDSKGRSLHLSTTWTVSRDEAGRIMRKSVSMRDITELKQLQAEESRAQRLATIGRMAAKIAHEVKNPVASIRLNMEMIEGAIKDIGDARSRKENSRLLESVMNELDRLEGMTQAYLQYIRIPEMRLRRQCLHRMLEELQDFMKREMESLAIEFVNVFATDMRTIGFDKDRMKQAILNLYKNCAAAMPEGGTIRTLTHVGDDSVEIRISDTGPGVQGAAADKMFEPFFTTRTSGTGLGLPIARDILAAHGGTLEFCPGSGEGASFVLRLPIER